MALSSRLKVSSKEQRQQEVLLGLVDLFIQTGKPVGSQVLKDTVFKQLSSATLRNYFADLEEKGYLEQEHASSGRIPTSAAFRLYAFKKLSEFEPLKENARKVVDQREITLLLQDTAEEISNQCSCPVFLSSPRFDQDYVTQAKIVPLDHSRCLCVLVTAFGDVKTSILKSETKINSFTAKRIEAFFMWRLNGNNKPDGLSPEEEELAHTFYNEAIVRYIVSYSNFLEEDLYRTGFSHLLNYEEFHDPAVLTKSLTLFENTHSLRLLLRDCTSREAVRIWVGEDLVPYSQQRPECSVVSCPYKINRQVVGAIGVLGPMRLDYAQVLKVLSQKASVLSQTLTESLYKYQLTFRQPENNVFLTRDKSQLIQHESQRLFLEDLRERKS